MLYKEEIKDVFTVAEDYYLVHCISADFKLGSGIAVEFNKKFNMREILLNKYPDYLSIYIELGIGGDCILEGKVFNLITKERYFNKPKMTTMKLVLQK